jgi:hypothetical protein
MASIRGMQIEDVVTVSNVAGDTVPDPICELGRDAVANGYNGAGAENPPGHMSGHFLKAAINKIQCGSTNGLSSNRSGFCKVPVSSVTVMGFGFGDLLGRALRDLSHRRLDSDYDEHKTLSQQIPLFGSIGADVRYDSTRPIRLRSAKCSIRSGTVTSSSKTS